MTIFGPDGSHHQNDLKVSDRDLAAVQFIGWRASISDRSDETYKDAVGLADEYNKPFISYHFVYQTDPRPGTLSAGRSAARQAAAFAFANPDRTIPVMLDWEEDKDKNGNLISRANWGDVLAVAAAIRRLGYRVTLVYTGKWYWGQMRSPDMRTLGAELVNADYGQNFTGTAADVYLKRGGDTGRGWTGYGGLKVAMWQFGSRVTFGNQQMDMNAIRDETLLSRAFKVWTPPPPKPVMTPADWIVYGRKIPTPSRSVRLQYGTVHENVVALQAVLCSMNTLAADGSHPIYNPAWVGGDMIEVDGVRKWVRNGFGEATRNSLTYWKRKNSFTYEPEIGTWTPLTADRMRQVRGK